MNDNNVILKVENLSKQYRLGVVGTGTLGHDLNRFWHKVRGKEDPYLKIGAVNDRSAVANSDYVWALQDINFEVKRGEILGIIGKNGAGKSTLLKILSRVTAPTTGSIKTRGRIASLLEVGTGMHPELTGRENIYLNGAILGMTKTEISSKIDEIVAFSGCEMYIDTPVKRYSSGMRVRLGFAVAAFLEPDILVVDEVLAVGDAEFQKKAIGKMQDISNTSGRTVLFVSHNMAAVQGLCTKSIVLENGRVVFEGDTADAIERYLNKSKDANKSELLKRNIEKLDKAFYFTGVQILNTKFNRTINLLSGDTYQFSLNYRNTKVLNKVGLRIMFYDSENRLRFLCNNYFSNGSYKINKIGEGSAVFEIPRFPLPKGNYYLRLTCFSDEGILDDLENCYEFQVIGGDFYGSGKEQQSKLGVLVDYNFKI